MFNKKVKPVVAITKEEESLIEIICYVVKSQVDVIETQVKHQFTIGKAPKDAKSLKRYVIQRIEEQLLGMLNEK